MVGTGRREAFGARVSVEEMPLIGQPVGKRAAHDHHALMRAIGLVAGKQIDISAKRSDIRQTMRGHADTIDAGDSPRRMRHRHDPGDGIFLADNVRAMRKTDQPNRLVQKWRQIIGAELALFSIDMPFAHLDPTVGKTAPDTGIGLVILISDNDGITRAEHGGKGLRQNIGVLAGRGTEAEFIRLDIHQRGKTGLCLVHFLATCARGRKEAIGLDLALGVEAVQAVDHLTTGIGATSIFKEGLALECGLGKGGKLRAHKVDVEFSHVGSSGLGDGSRISRRPAGPRWWHGG